MRIDTPIPQGWATWSYLIGWPGLLLIACFSALVYICWLEWRDR